MVYFSLQKIIYMFLLTISPSPSMENLLLSCILTTTKKKKMNPHKNSQRSSTMYEQYSILIDRITK